MITTAVVLAAGRGSRLREATARRSKAMLPIAGVPMIARVMEVLKAGGIEDFIVVASPKDIGLEQYCSTLSNVRLFFQQEPRGSGDALLACTEALPEKFLVSACDSLVPSSHIREIRGSLMEDETEAALSIMQVLPETPLMSRSVVAVQGGRVLELIEKPRDDQRISNLTALPLYALRRSIIEELGELGPSPRGEVELPAGLRAIIHRGCKVVSVEAPERQDLTDQRDLLRLNEIFLGKLSPAIQVAEAVGIPRSAKLIGPILIEEGVVVGEGVSVGPYVYLESGARVGENASLEHAVVLRDGNAQGHQSHSVISHNYTNSGTPE